MFEPLVEYVTTNAMVLNLRLFRGFQRRWPSNRGHYEQGKQDRHDRSLGIMQKLAVQPDIV
jgi:hypothetical protein